MSSPLEQKVCVEYASAIVGSTGSSSARDGILSLTNLVDTNLAQIDEMNICASLLENDSMVIRDALLPQLAANTKHLLAMFQTIDELGALADQMERTTRTTKDQVKNVQSGYDARHPKQVERFLGSLNMFRSKKDVGSTNAASIKPPMPNLLSAPIDIPDTSAIISSIRQGQSQ